MNFTNSLEEHIKILKGPLKQEDELLAILKKRLTKKEFKAFVAFEEGMALDKVVKELNCDEERANELYQTAIKKLNQEKLKQELML